MISRDREVHNQIESLQVRIEKIDNFVREYYSKYITVYLTLETSVRQIVTIIYEIIRRSIYMPIPTYDELSITIQIRWTTVRYNRP